jgi:hypothetical protein
MKFNEAYNQFCVIEEARSCKMKRKKKRIMKECGSSMPSMPMMMQMQQPHYGCEDEQGQMIVNNLMRIKDHAEFIAHYTQSSGKSEEWVQEKIAAVAREIDNIYHFIEGEQNKMSMGNGCGQPTPGSALSPNTLMGDKPGVAPVGTYVFSTEKKHYKKTKMKKNNKRKVGKIYNETRKVN